MENINIMRRLRLEYGVSLVSLAKAVGVSVQRISEIESKGGTQENVKLIQKAFEYVIEDRQQNNTALELAYQHNKEQLFSHAKEWNYGV